MAKLTLYIDVVSPYSYFSFHIIQAYRGLWRDVAIEIVPVSLNIVMKEMGNRPPLSVNFSTSLKYHAD
jgi:2-hydroxychromene-2-carboxylate isomerase